MAYDVLKDTTYLGDGVYAKYDGHGIELLANNLLNPTNTIYIEPQVYRNLEVFVDMIKQHSNEGNIS